MAVGQTEEVFAAYFLSAILRHSKIYLGRLRAFHKKYKRNSSEDSASLG